MTTDRARGITLRVLDFDAFTAKITGEQSEYDALKIDYTYALATRGSATYGICTEGVGSEVPLDNDGNGLVVDWRGENKTETGYSFSMFPVARYSFDLDDLAEFETGTTVDLADFVRTFGGRLESNFWAWYRLLAE
jgi:hypothetical protein